jgi:hypothetical protein
VGELAGRLREAREEVGRACHILVAPTPAALEGTEQALGKAAALLACARDAAPREGPGPPDGEIRRETAAVLEAVRMAGRLLEGARAYHARWMEITGSLTAGYTATGEAAAPPRPGRLCLRG